MRGDSVAAAPLGSAGMQNIQIGSPQGSHVGNTSYKGLAHPQAASRVPHQDPGLPSSRIWPSCVSLRYLCEHSVRSTYLGCAATERVLVRGPSSRRHLELGGYQKPRRCARDILKPATFLRPRPFDPAASGLPCSGFTQPASEGSVAATGKRQPDRLSQRLSKPTPSTAARPDWRDWVTGRAGHWAR